MQELDANTHDVAGHVSRIRASGILARSSHLNRLFEYLYACHIGGITPKEVEIAVDGLGRNASFDVTQDAIVRVYVHKLRRKLEDFYHKNGNDFSSRLTIPKGEYRFVLQNIETSAKDSVPIAAKFPRFIYPLLGLLVLSVLLNLLLVFWQPITSRFSNEGRLRSTVFWQPIFADTRPIVLVLGNYYIYAEADNNNVVKRLVRDFDLNSPMDLATHLQLNPEQAERKFDVGLSYIPTSMGYALNKLSPILNVNGKVPKVVLASELTPEILRDAHIVYIGHLSGMGMLADVVYDKSNFHVGSGYDELIHNVTGEQYQSGSGNPNERGGNPNQLAFLSSVIGPTGNQIITIAGFRDAGLKELADVVSSQAGLESLAVHQQGKSFEAIFQVTGFGQITSPARLVTVQTVK